MKEITRSQEELLKALWELKEGAVSNVLEILPDPKPAYNTVATVIKVLEKKGYLSHRTFGKTNVYYPLISKKEYAHYVLKETLGLFNGSLDQLVSSFVKSKEVSVYELEELKNILKKGIKSKRR
jgi:predicted transcriptional regulator